jgi:hypothetical protein
MYRREAGGTPIFHNDFLRQDLIVPLKLKFGDMVFLKAQKKHEIMVFVPKFELKNVPEYRQLHGGTPIFLVTFFVKI